jgi:hypothetical protein
MGQAVPAIVLWLDVMRHTNVVKSNAMLEYNLAAKVDALLFPFLFRAASGGLEFGVLTAVISGYAVFVGLSRGWITLPRHLIAPALIMLALTLVAPFAAFGEATIDSRFSILAACLLTAGAQLSPKLMPYTLPIAAIIGLLAVTHVADVSILNYECDAQ